MAASTEVPMKWVMALGMTVMICCAMVQQFTMEPDPTPPAPKAGVIIDDGPPF